MAEPMNIRLRGEKVSERSLELNVLSEVLNRAREVYGRAYLVGYTAHQEAGHGLDVSIEATGKILAAFQFKTPENKGGYRYEFRIGEKCWVCTNPNLKRNQPKWVTEVLKMLNIRWKCFNQHILLYALASVLKLKFGFDVHYALPLIRTYSELEHHAPNLSQRTVIIPVLNLPSILLDCNPHKIVVEAPGGNARNVTVSVQSRYMKLPKESFMFLDELLEKRLEKEEELPKGGRRIHIPSSELKAILRQRFAEGENGKKLSDALTQVSFTYKGTAIATGKTTERDERR